MSNKKLLLQLFLFFTLLTLGNELFAQATYNSGNAESAVNEINSSMTGIFGAIVNFLMIIGAIAAVITGAMAIVRFMSGDQDAAMNIGKWFLGALLLVLIPLVVSKLFGFTF